MEYTTAMSAQLILVLEEGTKGLGCSPIKKLRELGLDRSGAKSYLALNKS